MIRRAISSRSPCPRSRGYVLIMVLALLVLAAGLLVATAHAAMRRTRAAGEAKKDLQTTWGAISCRLAVLPQVEEILVGQENLRRKPTPMIQTSLQLGGMAFEIRLADEQAKASVNAMLATADAQRVESQLRLALSGSGLINEIRIRALRGPVLQVATTQPAGSRSMLSVSGFGQVFDGVEPSRLIRPMPGAGQSATDLVTCWGSGAINIRRAGPPALSLGGGRSLTGAQITRMIDARNALVEQGPAGGGGGNANTAPPAVRLQNEMRAAVGQSLGSGGNLALVEKSTCYSVWIVVRTSARDQYHLAVIDRSDENRPVVYTQQW